jgi:AraC-like DNA-binding protein
MTAHPFDPAFAASGPSILHGVAMTRIEGRRAIEDYVERLNRASCVAERRLVAWGGAGDELSLGAVHGLDDASLDGLSLAECRMGVALALHARDASAVSGACVVGLPVTGRITALSRGREVSCGPGEGLLLDASEVEWSRVAPGTHFIEFTVPGSVIRRLAAEWAPGLAAGRPRFEPQISAPLARRLRAMAAEVACIAGEGANSDAAASHVARAMIRRWVEMIGLTLLHEQPLVGARRALQPTRPGGPANGTVRRALDFIHAHADSPIGLAEIAAAAHVSARTLLRHFDAQVGETPVACLRRVRLDGARAELQARPDATVRDIASAWGFQNASKFAEAYRQRFGETPAATRGVAGPRFGRS